MSQKDKSSESSESGSSYERSRAFMGEKWGAEDSPNKKERRKVIELIDLEEEPEEGWVEERGKVPEVPIGYKVLLGLALLALSIWGVVLFVKGERVVDARLGVLALAKEEDQKKTKQATTFLERLELVVEGYLTATSLEEKTNFVRQSDRVALLMKEYYEEVPLTSRPYLKVAEFASLGLDTRSFLFVNVELERKVDGEKIIHLVVEETEDGQVLVDWESDVAYQPVNLKSYIANKTEDPVDLRLYLSKDHFYNYEFSDVGRYQSFKLRGRNADDFFFGYVERDSDAYQTIESLLEQSVSGVEPALLRVRFLPNTESKRSVLIEKVIAPRWIYVDDPSEESP